MVAPQRWRLRGLIILKRTVLRPPGYNMWSPRPCPMFVWDRGFNVLQRLQMTVPLGHQKHGWTLQSSSYLKYSTLLVNSIMLTPNLIIQNYCEIKYATACYTNYTNFINANRNSTGKKGALREKNTGDARGIFFSEASISGIFFNPGVPSRTCP